MAATPPLEQLLGDTTLNDRGADEGSHSFSIEGDGFDVGDDPFGIGPIEAGSFRELLNKDHGDSYMADEFARIILHTVDTAAPPQPSSDNSYVMSLCFQSNHDLQKVEFYGYPDNLPRADVFVDHMGWVPGPETARYLAMGYRVWNQAGYRLHFHGSPIEYASLNILRSPKRDICSQEHDQVPDLHVQILKLKTSCQQSPTPTPGEDSSSGDVKPWDARLPRIDLNLELLHSFSNSVARIGPLFNDTRIEVARPCYALDDKISYQSVGGIKSKVSLLAPMEPPGADNNAAPRPINPSYPCIGVDQSFLSIKYPPTQVTVRYLDREGTVLDTRRPDTALCASCQAVDFDELLEWGMADAEIDLGTDSELLERKRCSFCRIMALLCEDGLEFLRHREDKPDQHTPYGLSSFELDMNRPFRALFVRNALHCNSTKPFLVLSQGIQREYFGPIVPLRTVRGDIRGNYTLDIPRYVTFDLVKQMVGACDAGHGPDCGRKLEGTDLRHRMVLVDVIRMCLVEADGMDRRYVALSYVWGREPMFTTTTENFAALQVPGSLSRAGLCQTILDTVALARGLDIAFLWVDTLCILQDSQSHKLTQIKNMAAIYGHAYLTIVALTGTSGNSPLPGLSRPRRQLVEVVRGMPVTAHFPGLTHSAFNTVYEQRAWTFQERIISRRCLYVGQRQVFLECGAGETNDHEVLFPEMDRHLAPQLTNFNPLHRMLRSLSSAAEKKEQGEEGREGEGGEEQLEGPGAGAPSSLFQLSHFNSLITQYSIRRMSYASDIEDAFMGVQDVIARRAGWRFVAGLPTGVFDWALLWTPLGKLERMTWRESLGGPLVSPPSWSWFGWEGQVSYSGVTAETDEPTLREIEPLVDEYVVEWGPGQKKLVLERRPSAIWHEKTRTTEADKGIGEDTAGCDSATPRLADITRIILRFEADAVSSNTIDDLDELNIEWLNASTNSSSLRGSLRNGYRDKVMDDATSQRDGRESGFDLLALSKCKVRSAIRGGTFGEEKSFETGGNVVVMLVRWLDREADKLVGGESVAERVAIGYVDAEKWTRLGGIKKEVRLM